MENNISPDASHSALKNENEGIHIYIQTNQDRLPANTPILTKMKGNDWYNDTVNVKLFGDNTGAGNNGGNRVAIESLSIIEEHNNRTLASMGSSHTGGVYPDSPLNGGWNFTLKTFNDITLKWQLGSWTESNPYTKGGGKGDVPNVNYYIIDDSDGIEMYSSKAINLHPRNLGLLPSKKYYMEMKIPYNLWNTTVYSPFIDDNREPKNRIMNVNKENKFASNAGVLITEPTVDLTSYSQDGYSVEDSAVDQDRYGWKAFDGIIATSSDGPFWGTGSEYSQDTGFGAVYENSRNLGNDTTGGTTIDGEYLILNLPIARRFSGLKLYNRAANYRSPEDWRIYGRKTTTSPWELIMIQTGIAQPNTTGLSFYLETPTIDSYKSFAMAVSKVSPYTGHGLQCQISQLEYFCLEADHKITIGNNCIYDSKNQWWNLNNDVIHVTNHISSDDTEMTISWIDYNATRTSGWKGFIQIGRGVNQCIQIHNSQNSAHKGKVLIHNGGNWVDIFEGGIDTTMV